MNRMGDTLYWRTYPEWGSCCAGEETDDGPCGVLGQSRAVLRPRSWLDRLLGRPAPVLIERTVLCDGCFAGLREMFAAAFGELTRSS